VELEEKEEIADVPQASTLAPSPIKQTEGYDDFEQGEVEAPIEEQAQIEADHQENE